MAVRDSPRWPCDTPSIRKKVAVASPTSGGRSVGIIRSRIKLSELLHVTKPVTRTISIGLRSPPDYSATFRRSVRKVGLLQLGPNPFTLQKPKSGPATPLRIQKSPRWSNNSIYLARNPEMHTIFRPYLEPDESRTHSHSAIFFMPILHVFSFDLELGHPTGALL
jgi:hypothetical protein